MSEYGDYTQNTVIVGLERFPTSMWKNIGCDQEGCKEWDKSIANKSPESARQAARANGWQCDDTGDFCPAHSSQADPALPK